MDCLNNKVVAIWICCKNSTTEIETTEKDLTIYATVPFERITCLESPPFRGGGSGQAI